MIFAGKPKYTHEQLIHLCKEILPENAKQEFEQDRQTDKVVIWVVGISTAALGLILYHASNSPFIGLCFLKATVVFLLAAIVSGVIFRGIFYILEKLKLSLLQEFMGFCYGHGFESYGPIEITDQDSIEDIAKSLKEDMGLNYDDWLGKDYLNREFWVDHYKVWANHWRKREEEGLRSLGRAMAHLQGKTPDENEEFFLKEQGTSDTFKKVKTCRLVCNWSYFIMLFTFVFALIIPVAGFLIK